ncbi:AsmA family protein [Methylophaga sulfidovorans]|uniref:AsmA protein n=1 Tax=Methylophaga sulfidovorans TaxID=45496 RepID=A0A1I3YLA6_9GAMM|nr:AsmA family protein [Methylophaga sulfidovorans]SFK32139.1 AsmA protein [Methylophaga sulfidovorans]
MRTFIKIIVFIIVLVVAALIALPFFINPNDYKDEISREVEKATGRNLTLQGDIGLSVFPWIALDLGPLTLSNAEGFKADAFAKVQAAEIRIKLIPLLKKQLEMDTIVLDGLVLNLETDKNGKTNWDDLINKTAEQDSKPAAESTNQPEHASEPALQTITVAGVKLSNANILWSDASKGESYQLRNLNLTTDPLEPGVPTAVDMDFDVISTKPEAKAHVTLKTNASVDMEKQQYALEDLSFSAIAEGKELAFNQADLSLKGDIKADMAKQWLEVSDLALTAKASNNQQTIDAKLTGQLTSNLASQQSNIDNLDLTATIEDPSLPDKKAELHLTSGIKADLKQQTLTVSALMLKLQDLLLEGDIQAKDILKEKPSFAGSIHVQPFSLRKLASDMKIELPEMSDESTLEKVELRTELSGSTNQVNLKQLALTLDQSNLTGQFAVSNFSKPAFNFNLKLDQIDADRYMPPAKENKETTEAPVATEKDNKAKPEEALPLDALRQINAKGTIDIGKMKATGLNSENIHITIDAADGLVKLTPMSANLYKGQYNGNVILDARQDALKLSLNEQIKNVQAGPLLKDMTGDAKISGTANANAKLTGNGATVSQIKQTLTGNGGFAFTDGALQGINIAEIIRKAKAALKGEKLPQSDAPVQTDFSSLSGTFTATNGVINNQDLEVKSPLLRINGAGQASLPKEKIDYGLKVAIVGTSKGQGGKELDDLKGVTIPIKITGTFSEPKPTVDLANLVKDKAKQELKSKAEEKLKEKLGDDLGGLLGGKLGGSKTESKADSTDAEKATDAESEEEKSSDKKLEDAVKDKLKNFF